MNVVLYEMRDFILYFDVPYIPNSDRHTLSESTLPFRLHLSKPLPELKSFNTLRVRQIGKEIDGYVNGSHIGHFKIWKDIPEESEEKVGIQFKADKRFKEGEIFYKDFILKDFGNTYLKNWISKIRN